MNDNIQIYSLRVGQSVNLTICAREEYSAQQLSVKEGEVYQFSCYKNQKWKDWFVSSSPNGFFNVFALIKGLRVRGAKCFCLCGVYNRNDETAFAIGPYKEQRMNYTGLLSFFANDTFGYYGNNSGEVLLQIERIQ